MKKLELDLDALDVESFSTDARAEEEERGTVQAAAPCTCWRTCDCPTARYWCADAPETAISCDYTFNASCFVAEAADLPE